MFTTRPCTPHKMTERDTPRATRDRQRLVLEIETDSVTENTGASTHWTCLSCLQTKPSQDRRQEAPIRGASEGGAGRSGRWEQPEGRGPARGSAAPPPRGALSNPCSKDSRPPWRGGPGPRGPRQVAQRQQARGTCSHLPGKNNRTFLKTGAGAGEGPWTPASSGGVWQSYRWARLLVTPAAPEREAWAPSSPHLLLGSVESPLAPGFTRQESNGFWRITGLRQGEQGC